jgi:hypothetical protein
VNDIQGADGKLVQISLFNASVCLLLIYNKCFFLVDAVSFDTVILFKGLSRIIERANILVIFGIIEVNYSSFKLSKEEVMLVNRVPKESMKFIKRNKAEILTSTSLTYRGNSSMNIILSDVNYVYSDTFINLRFLRV